MTSARILPSLLLVTFFSCQIESALFSAEAAGPPSCRAGCLGKFYSNEDGSTGLLLGFKEPSPLFVDFNLSQCPLDTITVGRFKEGLLKRFYHYLPKGEIAKVNKKPPSVTLFCGAWSTDDGCLLRNFVPIWDELYVRFDMPRDFLLFFAQGVLLSSPGRIRVQNKEIVLKELLDRECRRAGDIAQSLSIKKSELAFRKKGARFSSVVKCQKRLEDSLMKAGELEKMYNAAKAEGEEVLEIGWWEYLLSFIV
jgi:hypothetical protein